MWVPKARGRDRGSEQRWAAALAPDPGFPTPTACGSPLNSEAASIPASSLAGFVEPGRRGRGRLQASWAPSTGREGECHVPSPTPSAQPGQPRRVPGRPPDPCLCALHQETSRSGRKITAPGDPTHLHALQFFGCWVDQSSFLSASGPPRPAAAAPTFSNPLPNRNRGDSRGSKVRLLTHNPKTRSHTPGLHRASCGGGG